MTVGSRVVEKLLDSGAPILIWEKKKKGFFKQGMLLNMLVCGNPECRFVHIKGFVIDERCEDIKLEKNRLSYKVKEGSNLTDHPLREEFFEASVNIDSYKVDLNTPQELSTSDLKNWVSMEVKQNLGELIRRRWRMGKSIKSDEWKKKDWSWWEHDVMVAWDEIYPDDPDIFVNISEKSYWVFDYYCVNPDCACQDVLLSFVDTSKKNQQELGAVSVDLKKFHHGDIHPDACDSKVLIDLWEKVKVKPNFKKTLINRHKEMKKIGKELIKLKTVSDSRAPMSEPDSKVGRNDPCPCGSGKKFKKCCY